MTHPVRLLWAHHGSPESAVVLGDEGICVLCGHEGPVIEAGKVVSSKFTDWDQYAATAQTLWCAACVWAHSHHDLRTYSWMTSPGGCARLDEGRLADLLASPLTVETAVIVPITRHKHLLPRARAGVITTDDAYLPWRQREVDLAATLTRLKALGFSETAISEPSPRWGVLSKMPAIEKVEVLDLWNRLDPWRTQPLLMAVGLRATRKVPAHV